jgi:hypothetical protein
MMPTFLLTENSSIIFVVSMKDKKGKKGEVMKALFILSFLVLFSFLYSQVSIYPLAASDIEAGDNFGKSVDISGIFAVVGSYEDDNGTGSAYVFKWNGENWIEECKLIPSDVDTGDKFGTAVAIDGDYIVVGSPNADNFTGAAYFFKREANEWIEINKVMPTDGNHSCNFGSSVTIYGTNALVGAPGFFYANNNNGSVYTYTLEEDVWLEDEKLIASDGAVRANFGCSVSLTRDNDNLYGIVGASRDDGNGVNSGSVYFFSKENDEWIEQEKIVGYNHDAGFGFSVSIDHYNEETYAIVGNSHSPRKVSIFKRDGNTWYLHYIIYDTQYQDAYFGRSVAIQGDYVIIGSTNSGAVTHQGGRTFIYRRYDAYWNYQVEISPFWINSADNFGSSVQIDSTNVIIGAFKDNQLGANAGFAYIYDMSDIIEITDVKDNLAHSYPISAAAFPNPFNPTTTIRFSIPEAARVSLAMFNIKGQRVASLIDEHLNSGNHDVLWHGKDEHNNNLSSGIYLYQLVVNGKIEATKKCIMMK